MSIKLYDEMIPAGNFPAVKADNVWTTSGDESVQDYLYRLNRDVGDCVRNIIAETDSFEQSIPSENQGLIEDTENVLIVHGSSETFGIPLLSDCENQIPSPYSLNLTSSNGVTVSPYYRYLTINSDGTGTRLVTSYLTGSKRVPLSETDLQAGGGFILMIQKNKDYPDSGKPIMRIQFFNSAGSQAKYYDVTFGDSNTFVSNVYAIPDAAVSFRIAIRIPSDAVYDNVKIYPILIKSDAVLRELGTEALADGAKVELPYSEIAEFSSVNTFNYEHSFRYKIDAKTYIDNHVSEVRMTYTTPEDFGAVGDGIADDSAAIEQCIAYGAEQQIPIRMNQTYLITSGIWINSTADIEINRLIYTGTDTAVIVNSSSNRIHIGHLTSGGIGFTLRGASNNVEYNHISLGMVSSKSHCISLETPSKPVVNNVIEFRQLKAGGDGCYCITNALLNNSYNTENTFIGGNCTYADWAFYGHGANNKFYSFNVENYIKGGFCFLDLANAIIVGDRHAESQRDGEYPFIKIKCDGAANNSSASAMTALRYISAVGLRVNEIDVSEAASTQVTEDGLSERALLSNGSLGRIDCRIVSYTNSGTNKPNSGSNDPKRYQSFGESCLIWGNTLIFQDTPHKYYTVTESLDLRTITEDTPAMPSVFEIACENCEIHLHPTYCFLGIKKFEVIQTETYQAKIYDYFTNSLVFDGTQYGAGTFEVSTYLNGDCARINGENMVWRVRKISAG